MKARLQPPKPARAPKRFAAPALFLGVDGGGTKTHAIITDERDRLLGEGFAGPSNPLRVGVSHAAAAVREAFDRAVSEAGVRRADIVAAKVGLAGVRRADLRARVRDDLESLLGIHAVEVLTDAEIALQGATNGAPGLVIIAGTGSICCGKNARGQRACAGGWGPIAGDEGGGIWIARRALQAVARATDGRGRPTSLVESCLEYFHIEAPDDLSLAIYAPNMTNERIAGFGRYVIEVAEEGDEVAAEIVEDAGRELGEAAATVISKLSMEREAFRVAFVGGVFKAGEMVLGPVRRAIKSVAPRAELGPPQLAPARAAARMARAHLPGLALAG